MPDLTDEQMDAVGEYAGLLLVKYDANNRIRLLPREDVEAYDKKQAELEALRQAQEEAQEKPEDSATQPEGDTGNNPDKKPVEVKYDKLEDFFVLPEGISIEYTGARLTKTYPDDGSEEIMSLDAAPGKKLLILCFDVTNHTGEKQSLDIMGMNASYKIEVNQSFKKGILLTLLLKDLSTFRGDISANSSTELVLITEVDPEANPDVIEGIETIVLRLKNPDKTCIVKLQ